MISKEQEQTVRNVAGTDQQQCKSPISKYLLIKQSYVGFTVNSEGSWHSTDQNTRKNANQENIFTSFTTHTNSRNTANK